METRALLAGDGMSAEGEIVALNENALARFELEVTDLGGNPLTGPLLVGDSFLIRGYAEDVRDNPQGVFSSYFDVFFNDALVDIDGSLSFGGPYVNVPSGNLGAAGLIDEVGGSASLSALGAGRFLVFSLPMVATNVGTATFTADPADDLPLHNVLVYGSNIPLGEADLDFGEVSVDIVTTVSIDSVDVVETNGQTVATFTVGLAAVNPVDVTVEFTTLPDTATAGVDYESKSGTVTIPAGQLSAQIEVTILGDTLHEFDETFSVVLSNAIGAEIVSSVGFGTILDDDLPPTISISGTTVTEGNAGSSNALFLVSLSGPSGRPISINFATADSSAIAGLDYTAQGGTLTFDPGVVSRTISVPILGDLLDEDNEQFFVNLSNPINVVVGIGQAVGTITDNDPAPAISIDSVSLVEGDSGTVNAVFTVTLSAASGRSVTVGFNTSNGTATAGADYESTSGTLTFDSGQVTQTIAVPIIGDLLDENDETFFVVLNNPVNATLAADEGAALIVDDDDPPSLSINDVTITEGNTGALNATFTVSLSVASGRTVSVNYASAPGTATAGQDYSTVSGTLTFAPGVTTQTFTVPILGDTIDEVDETFFVSLSNAQNATIADGQGQGLIIDNDASPTMSINDVTVVEGNLGTTNAVVTVSLSTVSGRAVTVNFATANATATAGSDYTAQVGTLTFPAGMTTQTISIPILGDLIDESDESFVVNLSGAAGAVIADGQGVVTIQDDDEPASTLSGYVYVDGNQNGAREAHEQGIPGVGVRLTGTNDIGQVVNLMETTDSKGFYQFGALRPGTYTLTEVHPIFFRDGLDTPGTQGGVAVPSDSLQTTLTTSVHGAENNFGELGLRAEFLSRRLFLASTVSKALVDGSYVVDVSTGDLWFAVDRGWDGTLQAQATPATGTRATIALYDKDLNLLTAAAPASGTAEIMWPGSSSESYFLRVGGGSPSVQVRLGTVGAGPSLPPASALASPSATETSTQSGAAPKSTSQDTTMAYWAAFAASQQQPSSNGDRDADEEAWGHAVDHAMRFLARGR